MERTIPILKYYAVFHARQIDGVLASNHPTIEDAPWTRPDAADVILKNSDMLGFHPAFAAKHHQTDRAAPNSLRDLISPARPAAHFG